MKKSLLSLSILLSILFSACSEDEQIYKPLDDMVADYSWLWTEFNVNGGTYRVNTSILWDSPVPGAKEADMVMVQAGALTIPYQLDNNMGFSVYRPDIPIKVRSHESFLTYEGSYMSECGIGIEVEGSMTDYNGGKEKRLVVNAKYTFPHNDLTGRTFEVNVGDESLYPENIVTYTTDAENFEFEGKTYTPTDIIYWLFGRMNRDFKLNSGIDKIRITFADDNKLELEFHDAATGEYRKSDKRRFYIVIGEDIYFYDTTEAMKEISSWYNLIDEDGLDTPTKATEYAFHQVKMELPMCDPISILNMKYTLDADGQLRMTWHPNLGYQFPLIGWYDCSYYPVEGKTCTMYHYMYYLARLNKVEMTPVAIFHEVKKMILIL